MFSYKHGTHIHIHSKNDPYKIKIEKLCYFYLYVYVWESVCIYVHVYVGAFEGKKRTLDVLKIMLQPIVSYVRWVAGSKSVTLQEQQVISNSKSSFQPLDTKYFM